MMKKKALRDRNTEAAVWFPVGEMSRQTVSARNFSEALSFNFASGSNRRGVQQHWWTTSMSQANTTTDHDTIRKWAESRGGRPARVKTSGPGGILRIDFGEKDDNLEEIEWEEFFKVFDERKLAFLYQDESGSGGTSRFNKFVDREG